MKFFHLSLLSIVLLFSSCGPSSEEKAQELLKSAQTAIQGQDYNMAKLKIDSIDLLYPNEIETIAQGKHLLLNITLIEQKQSLAYYDTLIVKREKNFEALKKSFVYEAGKFEGYAGTYIHKRQQVKNSHDRTYIRAYLDEKGDFYISSRYHGKGHIHHNRIKVYNDGLFAETKAIEENSFDNRSFDDGEDYWETVNYRNGNDNGVVSFIVNNYDQRLKVEFKGKKHHYIVMEQFDKEAIRDAYNLSLIITELTELKKDRKETTERIQKIEQQIEARKQ